MPPDTPLLLAFVGASLVLALTLGPAVVYIVAPNSGAGSHLRTRISAWRGIGQPCQCRWRRARAGCFVRCLIGRIHRRQMSRGRLPYVPRHPDVADDTGHLESES